MRRPIVLALLLFCNVATNTEARQQRSAKARSDFIKQQPCPSTGQTRGACLGYVVDHITPLCAGGPDHPRNMQWQTLEAAKVKDRAERAQCRQR